MSKNCTELFVTVTKGLISIFDACTGQTEVFDSIESYNDTEITFCSKKSRKCYYLKDVKSPQCPTASELASKICDEQEATIGGRSGGNEKGKYPLGILPVPVFNNSDVKQEFPIYLYQWTDENGAVCFTTDPEGLLITELNLYNMANIAGAVIPVDLAKYTVSGCVTLCIPAGGSITLADVLAEAVADGTLLPDGTAPTGFILSSITKFSIGQIGKDAAGVAKKDGSQIVYYDGDEAINAGSTYCPKNHPVLVDDDCDKFIAGEDLTKTLENGDTAEPALVRVCGTFIPLDADDADGAVQ